MTDGKDDGSVGRALLDVSGQLHAILMRDLVRICFRVKGRYRDPVRPQFAVDVDDRRIAHIAAFDGQEAAGADVADVIDETPKAYKDIDAVMAAQADLVEIVHTLRQIVCVKG